MSNLEYIIAAYAITLGALGIYSVHLWRRLRRLEQVEQEVTILMTGEREPYGGR
jgi:hypothetical protein